MHLVAVPLTRPPGVRTKAAAALQTNRLRLSNRLKRKPDDDDRLCAPVEEGLDEADNDNNDNNNEDEDHNEDNDGGDTSDNTGWINHFVDQPAGEHRRKNREGRLGWGKPEILKATGITEAQYTMYMVCISVILAVGLVDSIFPRNRLIAFATVTSM